MAASHYLAVLMMLQILGVVSGIGEHLINVNESGNDTLPCLLSNIPAFSTHARQLITSSDKYQLEDIYLKHLRS